MGGTYRKWVGPTENGWTYRKWVGPTENGWDLPKMGRAYRKWVGLPKMGLAYWKWLGPTKNWWGRPEMGGTYRKWVGPTEKGGAYQNFPIRMKYRDFNLENTFWGGIFLFQLQIYLLGFIWQLSNLNEIWEFQPGKHLFRWNIHISTWDIPSRGHLATFQFQ